MTEQIKLAIIGGTGVYDPGMLTDVTQSKVYTPFGAPSDLITIGKYAGEKIAFLPRHGNKHHLPPHKLPYRANIWALKELGVKYILAPCAVGSLKEHLPPGHIVLTDQFFDYTKRRDYTFYDGGQICHMSMAEPLCPNLRKLAAKTIKDFGDVNFQENATAVCIEGPRFSTRVESLFYKNVLQADIIGMTLVPEAVLAKEVEICYLSIAAVTDFDAWSEHIVSSDAVIAQMKENAKTIRRILTALIPQALKQKSACSCHSSLKDALS